MSNIMSHRLSNNKIIFGIITAVLFLLTLSLLPSRAWGLAQEDVSLNPAVATVREVVRDPGAGRQPPDVALPPGVEVPPAPGPALKEFKPLDGAVIEFVPGSVFITPHDVGLRDIAIDYINRDDNEVKVRVSVFRSGTFAPIHVKDKTIGLHEAGGFSTEFKTTVGTYWASIQATSEQFIVESVRFEDELDPDLNVEYGYEKIAAFALPSEKRLW